MRRLLLIALLYFAAPSTALAAPLAVTVQDKGRPTLCAEEDNVYATLTGPSVRRFTAIARAPAYAARIRRDIRRPNFTNCAITAAKDFAFTPRTVVLYRRGGVMVRGVTYPSYWRPEQVPVRVAGRDDKGFHLLQLFVHSRGRWQEVVVLHVADGYWRLRPLPLPRFREALYGSSFLVGPVEEAQRPFVRISRVEIEPQARRFQVWFAKGGGATLTVARVDRHGLTLEAALDPAVTGGPFLALRSMYVGPRNADTAQLRWTDPDGARHAAPAVGFGEVRAKSLRFARPLPSRHNTSAPDLAFQGFDSEPWGPLPPRAIRSKTPSP
jgi:hypothetical protein